jgi:glycosyltransferase involved in cell wall biosynthesis
MISYPDVSHNSSMYTDLTGEFALNGLNVYVAVANGPVKTSFNKEGNAFVLRIKTLELFNTSIFKKGLANILLPYQVTFSIKKNLGKVVFDVIIVSTPPITYLSTVKKLKRRLKSTVYLILRDIFPQNARDLGIIRNPLLFHYFRRKEKELYSVSDYIGCMSDRNISYLSLHNPEIDRSKLHLLPNWKNVSVYSSPDLTIRGKFGLENKYIALYGGNIGKPQKIDFILDLAEELKNLPDVIFLIIGNGSEKQRILNIVREKKLHNINIINTIPRDQYQELVKNCDVGLVNLSEKFTIPNIPSRTLSYWEAKLPVLAAIDENTDFSRIIEISGSGLCSITGDLKSYRKNFELLYQNRDLRKSMGENGYKYLIDNCTTTNAFNIIHRKLLS